MSTTAESDVATARDGGAIAVDRSLAILFAIEAAGEPINLSNLARATGLYKSTALRLLSSLIQAAVVSKLEDGTYVLGPAIMRLGISFERSNPIQRQLEPVLLDLVNKGTESASFHIRQDKNARVCIMRIDSHHSTLDRVHKGQVLPLDRGAAGRIITRFQSGAGDLMTATELTAVSIGERDPACAGLAAPVFTAHGRFLGAISLSGPKERFQQSDVDRMTTLILDAAESLTKTFGGKFPG